jgi:hypothetical protein
MAMARFDVLVGCVTTCGDGRGAFTHGDRHIGHDANQPQVFIQTAPRWLPEEHPAAMEMTSFAHIPEVRRFL